MVKIEDACKEKVRDAAMKAVVLDTLSFTFAKGKRMLAFANDMLEVGQSLPPDIEFNIEDLVSSNVSIKNAVSRLARYYRNEFSDKAKAIYDIGGAVTTDGMTLSATGDKYYDFNMKYFQISSTSFATYPSTQL